MRLLFDQNLPYRFTGTLVDLFPGSEHVKDAGLDNSSDREIWNHARDVGLTIMSKDADFHQMSFLYGAPPKFIWLRCGNCSVRELEAIIRSNYSSIATFEVDLEAALLVIGQR